MKRENNSEYRCCEITTIKRTKFMREKLSLMLVVILFAILNFRKKNLLFLYLL